LLVVTPAAPADITFPLLVGGLVPLGAFVVLEHRDRVTSGRTVVGLAGILLVLAVVEPPHGSGDVWSYAVYGRMLGQYHLSPYTHRPAQLVGDPALARVAPGWRQTRSVYGPGFTMLSGLVMAAAGTSPLLARSAFQGLAAIALLSAAALMLRHRVPPAALAAVVLNPLVVVGVVNGGHNDALVGLAVLSSGLALRRCRPAAAGLLLAAAILVKAVALLPAVAAFVWVLRHHGRRPAAAFIAGGAAPVAAGYLAFGGLRAVGPVLAAASQQSRASIWGLVPGGSPGVPGALLVVFVAAALVAPRLRGQSPVAALGAALAAYLLVAAYVLPWYFAWALPLAALDPASPLSRLVGAQTVTTLIAYQYQATRHPDALDHVLHASVAAARLFALTAAVAVLLLALSGRTRMHEPAT
jgi:alpha-1,6-mannosyltransferase